MPVIGFHNSHEQVHPARLLEAVQHAEEVGFTAAMCSDHLTPWNPRQGESGFAWSWLGAAMATTSLPFGAVNAPRAALPPGDRRAGDRDAGRDVPRPVLGGAGQR
ncbi:LLM class flavin-dependent oxidoreductase [Blastococcus sp. TML/C7B]|uniref:LLM class flavin-dependent oxidoreductase n=1 Tax=Blastococcus sp. TML/C7B TaxID=2798728 RepID=UPI00210293AB|nr:LLM class flavin-dependent oxidoreductase [Blastococcus sp. TML/C7B]